MNKPSLRLQIQTNKHKNERDRKANLRSLSQQPFVSDVTTWNHDRTPIAL